MILHKNINPKRHLSRSSLHLNDAGVSLFVTNFRDFLINFDKIWLQNKHNLAAYSSLSFNPNISCTPMANNNLLEIQQQRVDNAKSIIVDHLNINSIRNKFILAESIVNAFTCLLFQNQSWIAHFQWTSFIFSSSKFLGKTLTDLEVA